MPTPTPFDRQFRTTAQGMRRRPPTDGWDRVERRLDGRTRGPRLLGSRPWMIAAVLLLVAGFAVLLSLPRGGATDPLAQRAESMEELDASTTIPATRLNVYPSVGEGRPDGYLISPSEPQSRLTVAPKYRL